MINRDAFWIGRDYWARSTNERTAITPRLVTDAASEPVTTTEANSQLRLDVTTDNTYVATLITAARLALEAELNRSFITTTWKVTLDAFPFGNDAIILPRPPLIAITSIVYTDTSQQVQTLANTEYTVDIQSEPGRIMPAYTKIWPLALPHINTVTITYTAGYGATAAAVPLSIKQAILAMVSTLYENRSTVVIGQTVVPIPDYVRNIVTNDRWTPL